jgi:TM2 domain-containing membrane protein YozV
MTQPILMPLPAMNEPQRAAFYANYNLQRKDELTGVLLAVLLGGFGAHKFYLGRIGPGVVYLIFGVTGIPWIIALVEAFFMPARVRRFNARLAAHLASKVTGQAACDPVSLPLPGVFCPACGGPSAGGVHFCAHCGTAIA